MKLKAKHRPLRAHGHLGLHPRRNGHRQGACRTRPARRQQTGQAAFCGGQLRGPAGPAAGNGTVRL